MTINDLRSMDLIPKECIHMVSMIMGKMKDIYEI